MTSMPASRSARAMTLAPRSWPSSPGFAITTRSFLKRSPQPTYPPAPPALNDRHFFVLAPHAAERVAHLPHRRIGADGIENARHQVLRRARRRCERVERPRDGRAIARRPQALQLRELLLRRRLVDVQN